MSITIDDIMQMPEIIHYNFCRAEKKDQFDFENEIFAIVEEQGDEQEHYLKLPIEDYGFVETKDGRLETTLRVVLPDGYKIVKF